MVPLLTWADRGPYAAGFIAAALFLIGIPVPPFMAISAMVVAFATLRGGVVGATTAVGLGVAFALVALAVSGLPTTSIAVLILVCWIPTVLAAEVLRRTSNLPAAVGVIALFAAGVVLLLLMLRSPMQEFWSTAVNRLQEVMVAEPGQNGAEGEPITEAQFLSLLHIGAGITVLLMSTAGLFLARSGQAKMFNPGGFQREFHALYFGKQVALICLALVPIGFLVGGALGITVATVALFPLLLQGLAVMHSLVKQRSLSVGWLVVVYLLLMFVQPVMMLVSGVGLIDNVRRLPRH